MRKYFLIIISASLMLSGAANSEALPVFAPAYLEALPLDADRSESKTKDRQELLMRVERLERQNYLHDEPLVKTVERLEQRIFQLNGIIEQQDRLIKELSTKFN